MIPVLEKYFDEAVEKYHVYLKTMTQSKLLKIYFQQSKSLPCVGV